MDRIGDRPFQIYDLFEEERGLESDEAKEVLESKDEESWVPVKRARFNPVSDEELLNCLKREYQDYKDVNQYLLGTLKLDVFDCFSEFLGHYHKRSSGISKCSLLQAAIACKLPETALFLIRKMADLNYVDGMGWTALHYAVKYLDDHNASLEVIEQLIDEGCDPEVMDHLNRTALALALKDYKTKVVKLLIERGANVPDRIYDQPTLHYVVEFDDIELLKLILEKSRDAFYEIDEILGSVLHSAVYNFSIDIIKYFLEDHLEEIRRTKMDSLVINFRDVNVPLLQYVVSHEECDSYEKYNKTIPIINLLLEYGYGLEDRNELGQSMLQYVAT
ncbi:MAG: ankyrin repeat domain-containing protein, partial [Waddliaceae bacterium]